MGWRRALNVRVRHAWARVITCVTIRPPTVTATPGPPGAATLTGQPGGRVRQGPGRAGPRAAWQGRGARVTVR
ncbi:hypothetical protein GCM10008961_23350 [Deinococcus knuensis]|uniref:Uncharacterized protein n=1 Tax=Deinococcus knuensis TaxID=1837380 RepID=A0ABQ2SIT4_9DEIO|nr:hypothetical protein GCM10008961_23350 [Deinococcus knuensis]